MKKYFVFGLLALSLCGVVLVNGFQDNSISQKPLVLKSEGPLVPELPVVPFALKSDDPTLPDLPEVPFI